MDVGGNIEETGSHHTNSSVGQRRALKGEQRETRENENQRNKRERASDMEEYSDLLSPLVPRTDVSQRDCEESIHCDHRNIHTNSRQAGESHEMHTLLSQSAGCY